MRFVPRLEDYTLGKCIHASSLSVVYAAERKSDGRSVLLKAYPQDDRATDKSRAQRELEVLKQIAGPNVPEGLEVVETDTTPVLVLQRVPGISLYETLQSGPLSIASFLDVSVQLSEVIGRVHAQRLIHRDIHPGNVLIESSTLHTHLIDFGLTRPLGAVTTTEGLLSGSGTFHYISEQTGRMGRGVDSRSDLYSLGATLFFALTGRPPFDGADALALIHSHLAKLPERVIDLRSEIPSTLSRIIAKLLQKAPEDRYQTAHALHRDLSECRDQLAQIGAIASDFPLASSDAPYRPLFSKRIHGRDVELRSAHEALTRAASGSPTALVLRGAPGIGKSALIQDLRLPLTNRGGYLAHGKFDLYRRDLPYAGFIQALGSFAQQILAESDARLAYWRERLARATGALARVVSDLVPDLALVLSDAPPVPVLGPAETRARLALAVRRLVYAAASTEHPLVLFLDDLQWSDAGSRALLRELLLEPEPCGLLVLMTYRDNEVTHEHPFTKLLEELRKVPVELRELELLPLSEEACSSMLADALGRTPEQTRSLAACVARKTGNAPLLIQQFVSHMYDLGLIRFEPGVGWTWDEPRMLSVDIADDAVALMTQKIERLDPSVAAVLQLASCASDTFHVEILDELTKRPRAELEAALFALCDEGLIVPVHAGFRFAHDRIREAAQSLLKPAERARLHREAARVLLERIAPEHLLERAFEVADHLAFASDLLQGAERSRAREIHLMAGSRALASGAADTARRYLGLARSLFATEDWETQLQLGFDLYTRSAEAAFQMSDWNGALLLLEVVDAQPLSRVQQANVAAIQIRARTFRDGGEGAFPFVVETYRRFGIYRPTQVSWLRARLMIAVTDLLLRGPLDERAFRPATSISETMIIVGILAHAAAHAYTLRSNHASCISLCIALIVMRRRGYLLMLDALLGTYGAVRHAIRRDLRGADRLGAAALAWSARWPQSIHKVEHVVYAAIYGWTRPRRVVLEPLRRVAEVAREQGDGSTFMYALLCRAMYSAVVGDPLPQVREAFEQLDRVYASQGGTLSASHFVEAISLLTERSMEETERVARIESIDRDVHGARSSKLGAWGVWYEILGILGQHERLYRRGAEAWSWAFEIGGVLSQVADYLFFWGVSAAELATNAPLVDRLRYRATLRRCRRRLALWAREGPDFGYMVQVLDAERHRLRGEVPAALAAYAHGSDRAAEQRYVHHAAFIQERRGRLLLSLRRDFEAKSVFQRASALYDEWGAAVKSAEMRRLGRS